MANKQPKTAPAIAMPRAWRANMVMRRPTSPSQLRHCLVPIRIPAECLDARPLGLEEVANDDFGEGHTGRTRSHTRTPSWRRAAQG
eukprot:2693928-Alexandrium_andersonii.AAC.1